jgi:hypothetical protein
MVMETENGEHGDDETTGEWMVFVPAERWLALRNGQADAWTKQSPVGL